MSTGQRKSDGIVIEICREPAVGGVAGVAGSRKFCGNVIRIDSLFKVGSVAGIAFRR